MWLPVPSGYRANKFTSSLGWMNMDKKSSKVPVKKELNHKPFAILSPTSLPGCAAILTFPTTTMSEPLNQGTSGSFRKSSKISTTEEKFTRLSTKVTTAFVRSSLFRKRTKRTVNGLNFLAKLLKSQRKTTSSNSVIIKTGSSTGSSLTRRLFSQLIGQSKS